MRDVSAKVSSLRTAKARAVLTVHPETIIAMREGRVPKGDPLPVARIAAIQAVKNTPQLIPYCHTVPIDHVGVEFEISDNEIAVEVSVKSIYKTGVEMEAMAGAMVAALNLYDILKMIDDTMEVRKVTLLEKTGGKSDFVSKTGWTFGILVVSDGVSDGQREDKSGEVLRQRLGEHGGQNLEFAILPDDPETVREVCERWCGAGMELVVLTGGTGMGPRDSTPEALRGLFTKELTGVVDSIQAYGNARLPFAMLSRIQAGLVGQTVVIALPGSVGAVNDAVDALFPYLTHAFDIVKGGGHP